MFRQVIVVVLALCVAALCVAQTVQQTKAQLLLRIIANQKMLLDEEKKTTEFIGWMMQQAQSRGGFNYGQVCVIANGLLELQESRLKIENQLANDTRLLCHLEKQTQK